MKELCKEFIVIAGILKSALTEGCKKK